VRVAVAVSAAGPPAATRTAGASPVMSPGDGGQVTPATLQLQYVVCEVEEKMGQLVSGWGG